MLRFSMLFLNMLIFDVVFYDCLEKKNRPKSGNHAGRKEENASVADISVLLHKNTKNRHRD